MTKEKKPAALWYLVAINFLSSFVGAGALLFIVNWLMLWVVGLSGGAGLSDLLLVAVTSVYFQQISFFLLLWFAIWHTARYLRTTYIIPNPKKVVKWSAIVFIVVTVGMYIWDFMAAAMMPNVLEIASAIVALVLFYILSSKYLRS
jgi:hypothetical protein